MMKSLLVFAVVINVAAAFYQLQCSDSACSQNCQKITFPEGTCIPVQGGGSAKLSCQTGYVQEQIWTNSDCSGTPAHTARDKTGVCEQGQGGTYYENICTASLQISAETRKALGH